MRLGEIDFSKKVIKPKLYLCKPNKEIISRLNEAYNISYNQKLGALDEIDFKIPIHIEKNHRLVRNDNADIIKGRYLIRMILGNLEEYFIINQIEKVGSDEEYIEVKALNLGYELNDKIIRDYEAESYNLTQQVNDLLKDTIWGIGYVDSEFDLKYRSLDVSSSTVLEIIFDIAKTFNAVTLWDSINRKINFYNPSNIGEDKGFKIKYGKYLQSLNEEDNSDEIVTRLKLYGNEDISIREINPTGTPYIEDFTYFISPYEEVRTYENTEFAINEIRNNWIADWNYWNHNSVKNVLMLNNINTRYESILYDNSRKFPLRNYKAGATFHPTSGSGKFGLVFRYQNDANHYMVQWETGSPNPQLDAMKKSLETKEKDKETVFSNLGVAKNDLFLLEAQLLSMNDEKSILYLQIGSHEALIMSEKALGNDTTTLEVELNNMKAKYNTLLSNIPTKENDILSKKAEINQLEQSLTNIDIEITQLKSDIILEDLNPKVQLLKVLKKKNGIFSMIGEMPIKGWSLNVHYKMNVEVHNKTIKIWIDNRLVLECEDDDFTSGTFGIMGYEQIFEVKDVVFESKEYKVLEHSEYMSDDLAHFLLEYDRLLQDLKTEFERLISTKATHDSIYYTKSEELNQLKIQLSILLDERDVINTRIAFTEDELDSKNNQINNDLYPNASQEHTIVNGNLNTLKSQLKVKLMEVEAKENEVRIKENEIMAVEVDVNSVMNNIKELNVKLAVENSFTKKLLNERNQYIIEKEWSDSNISDAKDLLKEGIEMFNELKQEKITVKVSLVNFLSMITEQRNWDKLALGDKFKIEHEKLKMFYKAKITEIEYNFEDGTIDVTITNIKDNSKSNKFTEMLYSSYSTSTQVGIDSWKWDLALENNGSINEIINNVWDANRQKILGAKDQVIEISDRGLIIRDPNDPMNYLVGLNSMIAITNDGGQSWKHAITSQGIVGERIYGKIFMGVNLALEDEDGVVKWQGSKGEIFDRNGKLVMKMGLISEPPESTGDCFGLVSFNETTRVKISDCVGFSIDKWENNDWKKVLWANTDGTLYSYGLVAKNMKITNELDELIMDAENNFFDIGLFQTIVADGKLTTLEKLQLISELYKIHSDYKLLLEQAEEYQRVHADDIIDFNGAWDANNKTFPTQYSTINRYLTDDLADAYYQLITYMSQYVKVVDKGIGVNPLDIDVDDPLTEATSEINDRQDFIQKIKDYYDEAEKLRQKIQDTLFTSGINMGEYYNNMVLGKHGLVIVRSDGKYRAYLNATNGLALQKWENNKWTNKLYASIGSTEQEDGTLIAEDLVAKRLTIRTKDNEILLDADALNFDFTVLDSIIYDGIIMSLEKSTLLTQFGTITEQKNKLKEQISRYVNTIYNDRENSYFGLDLAKESLLQAEIQLDSAYSSLDSVLAIVFADMNQKTEIQTDLNMTPTAFRQLFTIFYQAYEVVRSRLEDFLEKSSLQLGRDYNRTVIDAENGITVTRENNMTRTRLNATDGISISRNDGSYDNPSWTDVFYVDTTGNLYAVDITTHNLKIVDGNLGEKIILDQNDGITINGNRGEVIRLNANEGISISVWGDPRFWIHNDGTIRAKKLIIHPDMEEDLIFDDETDAYISDLMVNSLKSLNKNRIQDYVYIKDNFIKLITGNSTASDIVKWQLELYNEDTALGYGGYPKMTFGAGLIGNPDFDKGYIMKTQNKFSMSYTDGSGHIKEIELVEGVVGGIKMNTNGNGEITLKVNDDNYIKISSSGIKLVGTRIDLN